MKIAFIFWCTTCSINLSLLRSRRQRKYNSVSPYFLVESSDSGFVRTRDYVDTFVSGSTDSALCLHIRAWVRVTSPAQSPQIQGLCVHAFMFTHLYQSPQIELCVYTSVRGYG